MFWGGGGMVGLGEWGGGARVSECFFYKDSKSKEKNCGGGSGVGVGGGVGGQTDEQAQTNFPRQLLRSWGNNNELMYKLCP